MCSSEKKFSAERSGTEVTRAATRLNEQTCENPNAPLFLLAFSIYDFATALEADR